LYERLILGIVKGSSTRYKNLTILCPKELRPRSHYWSGFPSTK